MSNSYFLGDDFTKAIEHAIVRARLETLEAGVPVFYRDFEAGMHIMEEPSGRKYEIEFIPNQPADRNYRVLREVTKTGS